MKKSFNLTLVVVSTTLMFFFLPSCIKDKSTHTYTIYTPVYKSKAQVRSELKTVAPQQIKNAGKIFIYGSYIYLNEVDKGIHIIDNSNPSSPRRVGYISIPGNVDLAVKGNTLYADQYSDLLAINVADPLHPTFKKAVANAFPYRNYQGFLPDTNSIIVDWIIKDTTVNMEMDNFGRGGGWGCASCFVMDAMSSSAAAAAYVPLGISGSMARFTIVNSMLYTVTNTGLNAFSITDPDNPVLKNKVETGLGIETIFPFRDKLFIGSNGGVFIYNITNAEVPVQEGRMSHLTACDPVIADNDYAYVTLRSGVRCSNAKDQLDVLDISNIKSPTLIQSYPMSNPHGLSKDGDLLFICEGAEGLKIFNAANVKNLQLLTHIKGFETTDVIALDEIAIVVEKNGIRQYDYSDSRNIKLLSKLTW